MTTYACEAMTLGVIASVTWPASPGWRRQLSMALFHYADSNSRLDPFFKTMRRWCWLEAMGSFSPVAFAFDSSPARWRQHANAWLWHAGDHTYTCFTRSLFACSRCCVISTPALHGLWHFPLTVSDEECRSWTAKNERRAERGQEKKKKKSYTKSWGQKVVVSLKTLERTRTRLSATQGHVRLTLFAVCSWRPFNWLQILVCSKAVRFVNTRESRWSDFCPVTTFIRQDCGLMLGELSSEEAVWRLNLPSCFCFYL